MLWLGRSHEKGSILTRKRVDGKLLRGANPVKFSASLILKAPLNRKIGALSVKPVANKTAERRRLGRAQKARMVKRTPRRSLGSIHTLAFNNTIGINC